jgi:hypothetical protein
MKPSSTLQAPFSPTPPPPPAAQSGPFTISGKVVTLATNSTDGPVMRARRAIILATHSPINRCARGECGHGCQPRRPGHAMGAAARDY